MTGPTGPRLAAITAFAVVAALLSGAWALAVNRWEGDARRHQQDLAEQTALRLQDWVGSRMLVLESIRAMRSQGLIVDARAWRTWVGLDLETVGGFQAINWVDADGFIRVTAPADGNEQALGKQITDHPIAGPVFARARTTRKLQASPPLDLFQGGRAFTTYLPVTPLDGTPSGYVNGVFRVDAIVAQALDHIDLAEHRVVLRDGDAPLWTSSDSPASGAHQGRSELSVAERSWTVEISPAAPVVPLERHAAALVVILLAAAAGGAAAAWGSRQARQTLLARAESERITVLLAEVERMESLGRVTGSIAHDFNNILTVVIGRASELEARLDHAPPEVRESLSAILDAGDRAAKLIELLLTFARRGNEVEGQLDAAAHLEQMAPMLRHIAGRKVHVGVDIQADTAPIALSGSAFDRILINLVTNAMQAATNGRGQIDIVLSAVDQGFRIDISDDGQGMSPQTRSRIFEPFFTTKDSGTGLGLATVYGLVTQAGGSLDVQSKQGHGTRFRITLPRS